MGVEIERKFKVNNTFRPTSVGTPMAQGYLSRDPKRTVRIRTAGIQGFLTIKGENQGAVREVGYLSISVERPQAEQLRNNLDSRGWRAWLDRRASDG